MLPNVTILHMFLMNVACHLFILLPKFKFQTAYADGHKSVGWLVGFHDISTFIGYLMANPFLYK